MDDQTEPEHATDGDLDAPRGSFWSRFRRMLAPGRSTRRWDRLSADAQRDVLNQIMRGGR